MCSSEQPLNGADSPGSYVTWPYRVLLCEAFGSHLELTVKAIGPNDARGQAIEEAHQRGYEDVSVVRIEALTT